MILRRTLPLLLALGALTVGGCDCQGCPNIVVTTQDAAPTVCVDSDGDGYGSGCTRGDDCDDGDPLLHYDCACTTAHPGCPCTAATPATDCYEGPTGSRDVGLCRGGTASCDTASGRMGQCVGQVLPLDYEVCNGYDDNCNRQIDEGVMSACGNCDPNCSGTLVGPGAGHPFDPPDDDNSSGVVLDPDGNLVLDPEVSEESFHFLYIANTYEGTVSKIDAASLKEVARYTSALPVANSTGSGPVATGADALPSRTAIDGFGDCYVANRAHTGNNLWGSLTKIAGSACSDKDGDGTVETSSDVNGNGIIDLTDPAEFFGDADECILFTIPIGGNNAIPRALALSGATELYPAGIVFVGTYTEQKFYLLDGLDGSMVTSNNNPITIDLNPYGAVVDSTGNVWTTQQGTDMAQAIRVARTGIVKSQVFHHSAGVPIGSYGIAIDEHDRVWFGGYDGTSGTGVFRFTPTAFDSDGLPTSGDWAHVDPAVGTACAGSHSRGVTVHRDSIGNNWVWAGISAGCIAIVNADTMAVENVLDPPGNPPGTDHFIGVGPDFLVDPRTGQTHVWAASHAGTGPDSSIGEAVRITYDYNLHSAIAFDRVTVGHGPYTYSDFTGYGLRSFTTRQGSYRTIVTGCTNSETVWQKLVWTADVPDFTQVCLRAIALDTANLNASGLAASAPTCMGAPGGRGEADISSLPGSAYLRIEVTLTRLAPSTTDSPAISALGATFICGGGG